MAAEITQKLEETQFKGSEKTAVNKKEINELTIKLAEIEDEIHNLIDKLAKSNEALFNYINKRISELDNQKKAVEHKINEIQLLSSDDTDILELNIIWADADFEKKKLISHTLIKEVRIKDNEIEIVWKI